MLAEILFRKGFTVKYIGDFYTTTDANIDVTLRDCGYDVPEAYITSYPLVEDLREAKIQLRCCDVVIAHKSTHFFAKVCYDLGIPFMPNFVSFFLPDSIRFWEVERFELEYDVIDYTLTCAIQAREVVNFVEGKEITIAPDALIVRNGDVKKVRMKSIDQMF